MQVKRPVLRYHGGKWLLAKWIITHFPAHRIYVELFGGAGSILMQKKPSYAEIYNDKWDTVVNVFQVLRNLDTAKELQRRLELTPFSRTEFEAITQDGIDNEADPIERARITIFRSFAGFGSAATNAVHSTGFRANSHRSGTTPAKDWQTFPPHIPTFCNRLKGVVIENKDYQKIIDQHDSPQTLFYADPPYVHETRNMKRGNAAYFHEMTDEQHRELADRLHAVKGMVVLSGYHSQLYHELYSDWKKVERKTMADGANERIEVLYISPRTAEKQIKNLFD